MATRKHPKQTAVPAVSQNRPNAALETMQIEAMQIVLRRMRASRSATLDPITHEKLGKIAEQ